MDVGGSELRLHKQKQLSYATAVHAFVVTQEIVSLECQEVSTLTVEPLFLKR